MPQWVSNIVVATGPKDAVATFVFQCLGRVHGVLTLDFEKVVPYPAGFDRALVAPIPLEIQLLDPALASNLTSLQTLITANSRHQRFEAAALTDEETAAAYLHRRHEMRERAWPMTAAEKTEAINAVRERAAAYRRNLEISGHQTWYDWCVANWGTKWRARASVPAEIGDGWVKVVFDTAYDAPRGVYEALREQYPSLRWTISAFFEDQGCEIILCDAEGFHVKHSVDVVAD